MEQQIQVKQSPEQILNDAASFFAKRRAKITDRSSHGFRFGLPGSAEVGQISIARGTAGGSTVTVQAEGLSVLAMAEGYVRDLRKQARDAGRQGRAAASTVALGDLRERLGMPPPRAIQRTGPRPVEPIGVRPADSRAGRPAPPGSTNAEPGTVELGEAGLGERFRARGEPAAGAAGATRRRAPRPTPPGAPAEMSNAARATAPPSGERAFSGEATGRVAEVAPEMAAEVAPEMVSGSNAGELPDTVQGAAASVIPGASAGPGALSVRATAPDGPVPIEAPVISPETGPQSAPSGPAPVEASHPSLTGPTAGANQPADSAPPAQLSEAAAFPSAEDIGGVPRPEDVVVVNEPARPNPGTPAGSSGAAKDLGPEASATPE